MVYRAAGVSRVVDSVAVWGGCHTEGGFGLCDREKVVCGRGGLDLDLGADGLLVEIVSFAIRRKRFAGEGAQI